MTRQEIIDGMSKVVAEKMLHYQTDFTEYDKPQLLEAQSSEFPFLWIVNEYHTRFASLGGYTDKFFAEQRVRYSFADGDDGISYLLNPHLLSKDDRIFLITEDKMWEVGVFEAKNAIKDYTLSAYEQWKAQHGEIIPKRVTVKFDLIELPKLRAIIRDCEAHDDDSLMSIFRRFHKLRRISDDHQITIKYKWWDNEFACIEHYNGEDHMIYHVKFHGWPETGYMVNGSVQIVPRYGWASHT